MENPHWNTAFWVQRLPIYEAALEQLPTRLAPSTHTPPPSLITDGTVSTIDDATNAGSAAATAVSNAAANAGSAAVVAANQPLVDAFIQLADITAIAESVDPRPKSEAYRTAATAFGSCPFELSTCEHRFCHSLHHRSA